MAKLVGMCKVVRRQRRLWKGMHKLQQGTSLH